MHWPTEMRVNQSRRQRGDAARQGDFQHLCVQKSLKYQRPTEKYEKGIEGERDGWRRLKRGIGREKRMERAKGRDWERIEDGEREREAGFG